MSTAPSRDFTAQSTRKDDPIGEYTRLRDLLLGPEQSCLKELQKRLDDTQLRTEELSQIVAEAIALRARRDRALQQALSPMVEEAVRISVTRNPAILAEALFPVIGEAVRKAVAHALRGLVESINQTLERSVSLDAVKWRFEALRTGRTFGEIVLARSLRYRVEQVFLIHRDTGLLLLHAARSDQIVEDSDLISGMLTAIQDFVRDSFAGTGSQEIDRIELGDFNLWVEHGPVAILAAVVSGTPPPELHSVLQRALEQVHAEYGVQLTSFTGDAGVFVPARPWLESCLLGRRAQKPPRQSKFFVAVFATMLLLGIGLLVFFSIRTQGRWDRLVDRMRQEPGIVLTNAHSSWAGAYELTGLRDPLSVEPNEIIRASGIDPGKVNARWEPYLSLHPKFQAIRQSSADKSALEQTVLQFPLNSAELSAEQFAKLDDIEGHIISLQQSEAAIGQKFIVEIHGHADATGREEKNKVLSEQRAERVRDALVSRGISNVILRAVAVSSRDQAPGYPNELNRRVTFHVIVGNEAAR